MSIVVTCPSCSATLKAPDAAAGKRLKCPKCTSTIEVPVAAPPPVFDEFTDLAPPVSAKGGALQPYVKEEAADEAAAAPPPPPPSDWESNRQTVGLLAVLVGALGIHKFVLGNNTPGLIMLLVTVSSCITAVGAPVMVVIGMLEGIKYLRMSDAEFYQTYVVGKKGWL
jgi:TM2 domain-containing membrane protein YozV